MEDKSPRNETSGRAEKALRAAPAFAAVAFVVLLVAFYVSLMAYRASVDADARRDLESRAELAAMTLAEPLRTQDFARIRSFGESCLARGYDLVVNSSDGGRIFATFRGGGRERASIGAGERIGDYAIVLLRSRDEVFASFRRAYRLFLLAALAGAAGMFFLFLAFYRQRVRLRELARSERFRREFVADVSHEIKTPLTGILGAVEMLRDEPSDVSVRRRLLDMVGKESKRLNALVQQILDLARLEREGVSMDLAEVDLADVAREAVESMRARAEAAGMRLGLSATPGECVANVDARLVCEAIANLVANAIGHSGSPDVSVSVSRSARGFAISVEDHGVGIPPGHEERVFERFHRVDPARAAESGGAGLGLAIVRRIARMHGGEAVLESVRPHGCRFSVLIPGRPAA